MNKKVLRAGAVSAVAAGIGAAAVMAGKRRSKKEEDRKVRYAVRFLLYAC